MCLPSRVSLHACAHVALRPWVASVVEDEFHAVFECSRYRRLRLHQRFACLFARFDAPTVQRPLHMMLFMAQQTAILAAFLHACWLIRCSKKEELELMGVVLPDEFWSSINAE